MAPPQFFERNLDTGYWQNINSDGSRGSDTDRRTEPGHSSNVGRKYTAVNTPNDDNYMDWKGGVVNQDVVLVLAEIQRNRNAFAILAENKRVDIAIVAVIDNIVKTSYKYFTQSLAKYLYYII
jgi:hypothetical protein